MHLNHPEAISIPRPWEKLSFTKLVPHAKNIRDRCVEESLHYPGARFYHVTHPTLHCHVPMSCRNWRVWQGNPSQSSDES